MGEIWKYGSVDFIPPLQEYHLIMSINCFLLGITKALQSYPEIWAAQNSAGMQINDFSMGKDIDDNKWSHKEVI